MSSAQISALRFIGSWSNEFSHSLSRQTGDILLLLLSVLLRSVVESMVGGRCYRCPQSLGG